MPCLETGRMSFNTPICVTSMYNVGCTFVDWSILYLSGQTHYYHANTNEVLELPASPLTGVNAHLYRKNHPHGLPRCQETVAILQQQSLPVTTFYPGPPVLANIQQMLGYTDSDLHDNHNLKNIFDRQYQEYQSMIDWFFEKNLGLVYIAMDPDFAVFTTIPRGQERLSWSGAIVSTPNETLTELHDVFYRKDNALWQNLGLTDVWDQRERWALEMRPLEISHPANTAGLVAPHCWINCKDLWYRGDTVIPKILEFLELDINVDRLSSWVPIYHAWRKLADKNIEFVVNLDHIIKSIVMGWYYQLPDLTLYQEAVIQHCLIYQHNLNLKTWGLVKFPNNTQALHDLLEANIHQLN
jgi:hypothetical protein